MIHYRAGKNGICFAFSLRGSVLPKACLTAVPGALIAMLLHWFRTVYDFQAEMQAGALGVTILGGFWFIFGFLIVFRSQQAYSRWWEGGTLLMKLRGEWFNAFSNTLAFLDSGSDRKQEVLKFEHTLVRLYSLLYGSAIMQISEGGEKAFQFMDVDGMDVASLEYMKSAKDKPEIVLQWIQRLVYEAHESKVITAAPPLVARVFNQLGRGIVVLNDAKKINALPIPFPLAQMILMMLFLHWLITAVLVAASVDSFYWCGFISFTVVFSFWSIHLIGEELEQPFGDDANDLPIREMQREMNTSLREMLDMRARYPPRFEFNSGQHMMLRTNTVDIVSHVEMMYEASIYASESMATRKSTEDAASHMDSRTSGVAAGLPPAGGTLSTAAAPDVTLASSSACSGGGVLVAAGQARGGAAPPREGGLVDHMGAPVIGDLPSYQSMPPVLSQLPSIASEPVTRNPYGCVLAEEDLLKDAEETAYVNTEAFQKALEAHLTGALVMQAGKSSARSVATASSGMATSSARSGALPPRNDIPKLRLSP